VTDRSENLRPWPKGTSGNPGGRPRNKPITEELERQLLQEGPSGKTWAAAIVEAMLRRASKGDVRAFAELADRLEGKTAQPVQMDMNAHFNLAERLEEARRSVRDEA
jgi:hypothetical protein